MRITATQPLFAWATLEDSPSLGTVRRCLEAIPDASLLQGLRQARGGMEGTTIRSPSSGASPC